MSLRISMCQTFPADVSTSASPYSAEPAVSGSATTSVSSRRSCLRAVMPREGGTKEPKTARTPLTDPPATAYRLAAFIHTPLEHYHDDTGSKTDFNRPFQRHRHTGDGADSRRHQGGQETCEVRVPSAQSVDRRR